MTNKIMLLQSLKKEWAILKDDEQAKIDRREACKKIVEISNQIKILDPDFEVIDISNTQYAEFLPAEQKILLSVNWGEVSEDFGKAEQEILEKWTSVAVRIAKKRLPRESPESQKFGMVVNAIVTHLLQINHSQS